MTVTSPSIPGDVRLAVRLLTRRPAFAAIALITLALGIGVPTAMFSVVHAALLRPLPYPAPDRIVRFRIDAQGPAGPISFDALPASTALDWRSRSNALASLALFNDRALTLSSADGPFRLRGISATPNLFEVLGTAPARGAVFTDASADAHQIVLSHATWTRFFRADPAIVGATITMDGEPYRVTGVMPDAFGFPTLETEFWVPQQIDAAGSRGMLLPAVARLKAGATIAGVTEEGRRELQDAGNPRFKEALTVETLQDQMVGGVRRVLWVLLGAVAFVLVIATVNVALLLLTRGAGREREFSIRLALGAGRSRLLRQLFVEGLTLGLAGGAAGIGAAWLTLKILLQLAPPDLPRLQVAGLDGAVLGFAFLLTLSASLIFGALSAGKTVAVDAIRALGSGGESRLLAPTGVRRRYLNLLAAAELALTMVLLVGAGLLVRSFVLLVNVNIGFDPRGAMALQVNLPSSRYPTPEARMAYHTRLLEALRHDPRVAIAGLATTLPNRQSTGRFAFSSSPAVLATGDPFSMPVFDVHMVTAGFMEAAGLRLKQGRFVGDADAAGTEPVMVISEQIARQQFPKGNALGSVMYSGQGNRRVVGIVEDVLPAEPGARPKAAAYLPLRQDTSVLEWFATINVAVRTSDPAGLGVWGREAILKLDANSPPYNLRPLERDVDNVVSAPRFSASVLGGFAGVALVMAVVGIYGVMAYSAGLRVREIGVRMALGATRGQVMRLMLRDGALVLVTGLSAGVIVAIWLARSLTGLLHEVKPADPVTLLVVVAILAVAAFAASFVPARRATRLTALDALRRE